jgi:transposase
MQGDKPFEPKAFYQVNLDDLVPQDNYHRLLNRELDLRWVRKETKKYYGRDGQKSIDPVVFVKLLLVGYLNSIDSDRRLMEHCSNRLDIRLYLGYDIDEALPWHSTISRTRQLWGEDVFVELFRKVLGMCVQKGLVRGKRQAMDAAPMKANASMDSLMEKEVMDDGEQYADELDAGSEHKVDRKRKNMVEQHHAWKKKAFEGQPGSRIKKHEDEDAEHQVRGRFLSNHTHYSPTDPDAKISVKPGKARQLNYHCQLSVDDGEHVITGAMAQTADLRDSQALPALVDHTLENLQQHGIEVEQVLADTGYSSGEALKHCEARGLEAYIPNFGKYMPEREGFIYNPEHDRYECQRGNRAHLPFKREVTNAKGNVARVFRTSSKDCKTCPLRSECVGKTAYKVITESIDKPYYDAMHQRLQSKYAKRLMKRRSSTVEPVLGTLVNFTNMRRVNTRGLASANKHVLMAALTYNLKKYMKRPWKNRKTLSLSMQIPQMDLGKGLSGFFGLVKRLSGLHYRPNWAF